MAFYNVCILTTRGGGRASVYKEFIVANRVSFMLGPHSLILWTEMRPLLAVALSMSSRPLRQSYQDSKQDIINRLKQEEDFLLRDIGEISTKLENLSLKPPCFCLDCSPYISLVATSRSRSSNRDSLQITTLIAL